MNRDPFQPVAHIGPHLLDKNPSLWLLAYAYVWNHETRRQEPYLLLRDPRPSRDGKDQASFVHFLAGTLRDDELIQRPNDHGQLIAFDKAARRMFLYGTGMTFAPEHDLWGTIIHREPTSLFSGPSENQQVVVISLCVGSHLDALPPITTIAEGGNFPVALKDNEAALQACDVFRQNIAWVPCRKVMRHIKQIKPLDHPQPEKLASFIFAPNASPFRVENLTLSRHLPPRDMIIQGSVLHVLEKMTTGGSLWNQYYKKPPRREKWLSSSFIAKALYNYQNGTFRNDPRLVRPKKKKKLFPVLGS